MYLLCICHGTSAAVLASGEDRLAVDKRETLTLNWGKAAAPIPETAPVMESAVVPQRRHAKPRQADPAGQWWGVVALDARGRAYTAASHPIFRHPTAETANSEAEYLSATNPDRRFVVLHCCASFKGGNKQ